MSETTRTLAIQAAMQLSAQGSERLALPALLETAAQIHNFIVDASPTTNAAPSKAATAAPAKPKTPAKFAKTEDEIVNEAIEKAQAKADAEDKADGASGPKKEDVGRVVTDLLQAGKRDEAVGLLKKFGATSVSGVKEADYAKFVAEGQGYLLSA